MCSHFILSLILIVPQIQSVTGHFVFDVSCIVFENTTEFLLTVLLENLIHF